VSLLPAERQVADGIGVSYGKAIRMEDYEADFLVEDEGARKLAVKRLTRKIDLDLRQMTVNGPDWWVFGNE
jgi:glycerol-3-phosphate O-acyltransferase/dihydroxyacetone phosphate acyltransferase